jgi:hypothetical protein
MVQQVRQAYKVNLEQLVPLAYKAMLVLPEHRGSMELQAQQDHKDHADHKDRKDP